MKKITILSLFIFNLSILSYAADVCVPAREYIDYPKNIRNGMYYRFSPEGDKIIVSQARVDDKGEVGVINISEKDGKKLAIATPTNMTDEAYPVEGMKNSKGKYEWQVIAAPYGHGGMNYFLASGASDKNVFKNAEAKSIFKDSGHDEWYHSTASDPSVDGNTDNFKVMLWSDQKMKAYKVVRKSDGSVKKIEAKSKTYDPCTNLRSMEGPIISKDASMVSFTENYSTVIYKIDHKTKQCELVRSLGYETSKVSFNYPGERPIIAFKATRTVTSDSGVKRVGGVYAYNYGENDLSEEKRTTLLSSSDEYIRSYPGQLTDGRIMYIARLTEEDEDGFEEEVQKIVIVDPAQINKDGTINKNPTKCINKKGVSGKKSMPKSSDSKVEPQ